MGTAEFVHAIIKSIKADFDFECEKHGKAPSVIMDGKRVCAFCAFEKLIEVKECRLSKMKEADA